MLPACLIVARKGSKRLPGKNTLDFMGEPLFMRVTRTAQMSELFKDIFFSTDDERILEALRAKSGVCLHQRSRTLAGDDVTVMQVLDALLKQQRLSFEGVRDCFILTPCAPLLTPDHLRCAWQLYLERSGSSLFSVTKYPCPPELSLDLSDDFITRTWRGAARKADHPVRYYLNGAIIIVNLDEFRRMGSLFTERTLGFVMPSHEAVDIDEIEDLDLARFLAR